MALYLSSAYFGDRVDVWCRFDTLLVNNHSFYDRATVVCYEKEIDIIRIKKRSYGTKRSFGKD